MKKGVLAADYEIAGNIKNNATMPLGQFSIHATASDCPTSDTCVVIGDNTANCVLSVPSQQMRAFDSTIEWVNLPTATHFQWNYEIVAASQ